MTSHFPERTLTLKVDEIDLKGPTGPYSIQIRKGQEELEKMIAADDKILAEQAGTTLDVLQALIKEYERPDAEEIVRIFRNMSHQREGVTIEDARRHFESNKSKKNWRLDTETFRLP